MYPIRRIRSFVRREGRKLKHYSKTWSRLWPIYGLEMAVEEVLDLESIFQRSSAKIMEIGFGDGHSLIQMALEAPEKDFIGIEVYKTGVCSLLAAIETHHITNIRVFCADALEVLGQRIPNESLEGVQVFFADPWPKTRHHKRRLVQTDFANLVAKKLKKGGTLHLATDWMDYANHMMTVMSENTYFANTVGIKQFTPRPAFRPLTKYEQKGLEKGHQTWDLIFRRTGL